MNLRHPSSTLFPYTTLFRSAAAHHMPVLHHAWQRRPSFVPGQDPSDAIDLCGLAARHPSVAILLAHIGGGGDWSHRSEEHTSELQSQSNLVCRLLLEKK